AEAGGVGGSIAVDPRGRAGQAKHAANAVEGVAVEPGGAAANGVGEIAEAGAGRAGLGCDEVSGERPDPALRNGQRAGSRCTALPGRQAGGGRSAVGGLQGAEVLAAEQRSSDGGGGDGRSAGGGIGDQHLASGAGNPSGGHGGRTA